MVNINIQITDDLHKKLKVSSVVSSKTLKEYIIEELSKRVNQEETTLNSVA